MPTPFEHKNFSKQLLKWFDQFGRHDLPWQKKQLAPLTVTTATDLNNTQLYQVWVSEIMLQQTQVVTVLRYFNRFIQRFPNVSSLASASWDDVAPYWAGLGYYARARNLHKAAGIIAAQGYFPHTVETWMALSGIGRSTAGALMALGLGSFGVIMDGNVKRVLMRYTANDADPTKTATIQQLWILATQFTPKERFDDYAQAMMDLGATVCTLKKPRCTTCPFHQDCQAYKLDRAQDFPRKTIRQKLPHKQADVLLLRYEDKYLWQQRPASGLWGGLWVLPMIENNEIDHDNAGLKSERLEEKDFEHITQNKLVHVGSSIKHTFTHFVWHLEPKQYQLDHSDVAQIELQPNQRWMTAQEAIEAGLPTAMIKVLNLEKATDH